jgi:hypothetical protein
MRAEFITHDLIQPKIKDEGKEPAPIRSSIVHSAMSSIEKHTPTVTVSQLQITIPVQSGEARETCRFEPRHISLGQRHLRVDTTEVAVVALAGVCAHLLGGHGKKRQVIHFLVPASTRIPEDVSFQRRAGIAVEPTGRHEEELAVARQPR